MPLGWPAVLPGLIRRFAETEHTLNSNRKMRDADPQLKSESVVHPLCHSENRRCNTSQGRCMSAARPRHTRPIAGWILRRAHRRRVLMSSVRSATSAARRVPSQAGPSPRAAGPPFHVGGGSTGQSALPPPQRVAGSYPSFQPQGGLVPSLPRHPGTAVPSARPHDRRVRNVSPGNPTRPGGWEQPCLQPWRAGAAGPESALQTRRSCGRADGRGAPLTSGRSAEVSTAGIIEQSLANGDAGRPDQPGGRLFCHEPLRTCRRLWNMWLNQGASA